MRLTFSIQYDRQCVIIEEDDTFEDLVNYAEENGAMLEEDGPGDWVYVVQFPGRDFPELYTPTAIKGSLTPEAWDRFRKRTIVNNQ